MEDSLRDVSFNFSMDKKRKCNSKEDIQKKERKILLKEDDELKVIKTGRDEKKKEEEEKIMLFENDEIVEYTPRYVKNNNTHIVLAEEEYVNTLEKLIERNYFPDIAKYKSQLLLNGKKHVGEEDMTSQIGSSDFGSSVGNAFSDLISECDSIKKKKESQENLYPNNKNILALPDTNPFCFKKKKEDYQLVLLPNGKEHKINLHMSLRQFQNTYTSEDNKSFDYLLNKMKNLQIEKNMYSIEKRKKHNMLMDKIDEYTKRGINCHMLHTNKADDEEFMMKFSSGHRISDILEVKRHKVDVNIDSTRFSKDDNEYLEKQIEGAEEMKQLRFLKKINEEKTEKMIAQGKFHLLKENNGFDYIRTPITEIGNASNSNYSCSMKRGKHANSPISADSISENEEESNWNKISATKKRRKIDVEEEETEDHKNEFNLQGPSNRELVADRLQSGVKNVKYNKQALRNKYLKSVINKRYSSKMSTTSFKHSVLSKYSQKRLNELAQKSSLASQLLRNKESRP